MVSALAASPRSMSASGIDGAVATVTLNRPERKNPLTFELLCRAGGAVPGGGGRRRGEGLRHHRGRGNFSSGGDVFEIIGPLLDKDTKGLLAFTTMTGNLVKAMRGCPQPIVAAIDGVCAGAGAILAMASDLRIGTARAKIAFLFNRVGLAGCDMGACAMLPRIVGQGRAAELLFTGRSLSGEEAERWGFLNRLVAPEALAGRGGGAGGIARRRAGLRQRADQAHARDGMGDGRQRGDRRRGGGAGALP